MAGLGCVAAWLHRSRFTSCDKYIHMYVEILGAASAVSYLRTIYSGSIQRRIHLSLFLSL